MRRARRKAQAKLLKLFDCVIAFERDSHRLTRAELDKAIARAADLDDRLLAARNYISTLERHAAANAPASWRWRMSTTEGDAGVTND